MTMLTGCHQPMMQRCVDVHNVVVDDSLCGSPQKSNPSRGFYPNPFRWYYGGSGMYYPGSIVTGGGFAPLGGQSYVLSTSRGGFGSTFGHGGGGGEE